MTTLVRTLLIFSTLAALSAGALPCAARIAVVGDIIHTAAGPPIENGVVLVKDGKVEAIGPAADITIPNDYRVYRGAAVTPGLVDAHATVGLTGIFNQKHDQDHLDKSSPIQPELRASDAYNPLEDLVAYLRSLGITTVHTGHSPGALMSGQTMIAKTAGATVAEAMIDDGTMVAMSLSGSVRHNFDSPGTRSKGMALLRTALLKAQQYARTSAHKDESKRPARNLKNEVLSRVLNGEVKALITAQRAADIMAALRLAKEFNLKLVLDGAAEAYLLVDQIKAAGAEVIVHPTMARAYGDLQNISLENAAILTRAGIPVAIQSGYEGYVPKTRVILYEAAVALANGLPFDAALRAITINAARIIGAEKRVGSLEVGKDADIVLYDGDPFEYTTHVCTVIIDGEVVSETCP